MRESNKIQIDICYAIDKCYRYVMLQINAEDKMFSLLRIADPCGEKKSLRQLHYITRQPVARIIRYLLYTR